MFPSFNKKEKNEKKEKKYSKEKKENKKKAKPTPKSDVPREEQSSSGAEQMETPPIEKSRMSSPQAAMVGTAGFPDMPASFSIPITAQDKQILSRIISNITEPEANQLASTIVEIGKINSRAQRQHARAERMADALTDIQEQLHAKQKRATLGQDSVMRDRDPYSFTPAAESGAAENDRPVPSSRMPSLSHSAQSELDFAPSPTSQDMNAALLPDATRAGQPLRYTLPSEKFHAALDDPAAVGAGEVMSPSTLERESADAKLLRIKREIAILENLPRLLDEYPAGVSGN
jgi:hypothetical protein